MAKAKILHMITPGDNVSPFDVNMAADAGFEVIVPYSGIDPDGAGALVQDAIFSRPPKSFASTGVFIGGHDVNVAADMFERAKQSVVPPFEVSVFADPNGAYTTAAALVAVVEKGLASRHGGGLSGREALIFGGGPVGLCAAVLIEKQGGRPTIVRLTSRSKADAITRFSERYQAKPGYVDGQSSDAKAALLKSAHVAICTAKAGIRVLDRALLDQAPELLAVADVNAVPPSGIEGVSPTDAAAALETAVANPDAYGALAVGKVKYDLQQRMLRRMLTSERAEYLDFLDAFELAAANV